MKLKNIAKPILLALSLSIFAGCANDTATKEGSVDTKEENSSEGVLEGVKEGYGEDVLAKVSIKDGVIENVDYEAEGETDTIGQAAIDDLSKEIVDRQSTQIDTIAGATVSSEAFLAAVNEALKSGGIN